METIFRGFVAFLVLLLTPHLMLALWCGVAVVVIWVGFRTKMYGLIIMAGSVLPHIIFQLYGLFNVWDTVPLAIAVMYARVADISLAVGLVMSVFMMYRGVGRYAIE